MNNGKNLPVLTRPSRKHYRQAVDMYKKKVIDYNKKTVKSMNRTTIIMIYFAPMIFMLIVYILARVF